MRRTESGFTLIELLTVVAIIGVLAAIGIPSYASYKSQGIDAEMISSLRNARTACEAFYVQTGASYAGMTLTDLLDLGFRQTFGVAVDVMPAGDGNSYTLRACADGGSAPSFLVTSAAGAAVADAGACS
ncbi:MAG: type IV pilin protein [Candidatus Binatia bacterium]